MAAAAADAAAASNKRRQRRPFVFSSPRGPAFALLSLSLVSYVVLHSNIMIQIDQESVTITMQSPYNSINSKKLLLPPEEEDHSVLEEEEEEEGPSLDEVTMEEGAKSRKSREPSSPSVVWLASYPNSGTSYTMTMVERATNLSTASNYGAEVTAAGMDSVPVVPGRSGGPYWEGLGGELGHTVRHLPVRRVLTKTHCGGRCVRCGADEYVVSEAGGFAAACLRTTGTVGGRRVESAMDAELLAGVVHLVRSPFDNVVARYHLERRHAVQKRGSAVADQYPNNVTGFQRWCRELDERYEKQEDDVLPPKIVRLMRNGVPCRAEFYKYTQWHNLVRDVVPNIVVNDDDDDEEEEEEGLPVHTVYYEDYQSNFNQTVTGLLDFLRLTIKAPVRPFRSLPDYADHYTTQQRRSIRRLVRAVAKESTWNLLARYFPDSEETATK